jgi:hypothetical protein
MMPRQPCHALGENGDAATDTGSAAQLSQPRSDDDDPAHDESTAPDDDSLIRKQR